jgi:SAM-dependent methyltransferase
LTGYDPARYGNVVGDDYDDLYPGDPQDTQATVETLAELARARPEQSLLELGIGTGRIALGVHRLGLRVVGIDGSDSMVSQLRDKAEGDQIDVAIGDYRTTRVDETFATVALLYNGIFDPRGPEAQLDIFRNAACHLDVGGCFVVESFVLSDAQRAGGWWVNPRYVASEHVELQFAQYDIKTNRVQRTFIHMRPSGLEFLTVADTYASPGELDLMANFIGFELSSRTGGWRGEEYTAHSTRHVSVFELRHQPEDASAQARRAAG